MALKLTEIQLPDGQKIWIQYDDEADVPGGLRAVAALENAEERAKKLMDAIRGYSKLLLDAVKKGMDDFTPDKVTLEFGVQFGGEAGIPFVAKGTAQASAKVSAEWNLKDQKGKSAK